MNCILQTKAIKKNQLQYVSLKVKNLTLIKMAKSLKAFSFSFILKKIHEITVHQLLVEKYLTGNVLEHFLTKYHRVFSFLTHLEIIKDL